MSGPKRENPPGQEASGEEANRLSAAGIPRRRSCVNYPIIVDAFALDPNIDFPIACFERMLPESCDDGDQADELYERLLALEKEVLHLSRQASRPAPVKRIAGVQL
jgi:hypothetical protein